MDQDTGNAIDRLSSLLDDEAVGRPFDPTEAIALAEDVARTVPELASFMGRVIRRMKSRQARVVAA